MPRNDDDVFSSLFLDADDLPQQMKLYGDRRVGFSETGDQAYRRYGGLKVGMTKWDGPKEGAVQLLVDIRWLFPDAQSATAYHLETLQMKSENKPENHSARKIGDNCHVYSFPSGQELGAAQRIFVQALGEDHQMARGMGRAINEMPDDAFIYLFTRGRVAVKYFVVLSAALASTDTGKSTIYDLAEQIVRKVDRAFPNDADNMRRPWWKRMFSN
jgi:hypothetical protein